MADTTEVAGKVNPPTEPPKESPEVAQLRSELEAERQARLKAEDNWKNEQRISAKKDIEIQRGKDTQSHIETLEDTVKVLTVEIADIRGKTEEDMQDAVSTRKPQIIEQFDRVAKERERKRFQEEVIRRTEEIQLRTDALGMEPDSDAYATIMLLTTAGNFDLAEKRLTKLEAAKKKETETPKMSQEEIEKLANEKAKVLAEEMFRAQMEKSGLLKTDAGTGATAGGHQKVSLSRLSQEDVKKLFPNREVDIFKGIAEGWVDL